MGSSIIKQAFTEALCRPGGANLGLERLGINIWWQGYSGLRFLQMKSKLSYLKQFESDPDYLIMHAGGNDIGVKECPLFWLIKNLRNHLQIIRECFPNSVLVWSQILPRTNWRYSQDSVAMENFRIRLNRAAAKAVLNLGGCYIKHPDLLKNITQFLRPDGVHLTELGYGIFLNTLQGGLEYFALKRGCVFPSNW